MVYNHYWTITTTTPVSESATAKVRSVATFVNTCKEAEDGDLIHRVSTDLFICK